MKNTDILDVNNERNGELQKAKNHEVDYAFLNKEHVRERMGERMNLLIEQIRDQKIDCLVFLDKSARPLSWLFRECWKVKFPDEDVPMIKFANVGNKNQFNTGYCEYLDLFKSSSKDCRKIKELVSNAEDGGDWLNSENIGESWQDTLYDESDVFQQMRSVYGDSFDGKKVLIVDEYGYSGFTQVASLLSFSKAFSEADWQSVPFYESVISGDKHWVPWFGQEGASGVLEIPDSLFLSGSLSKTNFEQIGSAIDTQIADEVKNAKEKIQNYLQDIDELSEAIPYMPKISDQVLQKELKRRIALQKEIMEKISTSEDFEDDLLDKNKENIEKINDIARAFLKSDKNKYGELFGACRAICFNAFSTPDRPDEIMNNHVQGSIAHITQLRKIKSTLTESKLEQYKQESKQLRQEMKKLAHEISSD
jgi:hypothetical protein